MEIYFGAVDLAPYLVRQDRNRFVFRDVPQDVQEFFNADLFIPQPAFIHGVRYRPYRPLGGSILHFGHYSNRVEFPHWYWIGGGTITFYLINCDDDYASYLLQHAERQREGVRQQWR